MIDTKALRSRILDLAIQGKISSPCIDDDNVDDIAKSIPEISAKRKSLLKKSYNYDVKFDIPKHWRMMKLGQISSYGDTPKKAMISETTPDTWILELEDIQSGGALLYKKRVNSSTSIGEKTVFKKNQVLYSKLRPYLKKVLVADENGISTPELISFDVYGGIVEKYIVFYLTNSFVDKMINNRSYGVKMPRVDAGFMVNLPIPVPPLAEQKRIVQRVEEIFRILDTIDEAQEKYSADAASLRSKLITACIQGKLTQQFESDGTAEELYQRIQEEKQKLIKDGKIKKEKPLPPIKDDEIPFEVSSNWKWCRLNEISEKITSGSTPPGGKKGNAYVKQGYCFFREQNIYNDGIHMNGMVYIAEELLNTRKNSTVIANDILLNITGGSIGRCAIIPDDFTKGSINQHILIIRLVNEDMRYFIHQILCSPYVQKLIKSKAVGDKDGFSGGRCKAMLVPLPPLAEQKRIAEKLGELLGVLE